MCANFLISTPVSLRLPCWLVIYYCHHDYLLAYYLLFTSDAAYYIVIYFHCYHDYHTVYTRHHDDLVVCRFERGNVLAIFSSSIVVVLAAMTIVKHSMERLFDPPVINTCVQ